LRYRSTLIYLLAALILGGLYFWDVRSERQEEAKEDAERVIFQVDGDKLRRIALKRPDQEIVLQKTGDAEEEAVWRITEPVDTEADSYAVNYVANLLPALKHTRIIEENPEDLAPFNLEEPGLTVSWATEGEAGGLLIGGQSPMDKGFYAKKQEDPRVFLIALNDKEILDKTLYDLRDKGLFSFAYDEPTRLEIQGPGQNWAFVKSGETTWALPEDPDFPLDSEEVSSVVRRLTWEEAASFEAEKAEDLKTYGLEVPLHRIVLSNGEKREELLVGSPAGGDEGGLYARMAERPQVVTIKKETLEGLPASLEELRTEEPEAQEEPSGPPGESGGETSNTKE